MKQLKYILFLFAAVFTLQACEESTPTFSNEFVSFDTRNGMVTTLSVTEGKNVIVTIVSSSPKMGADNTISFNVIEPTVADPASAAYVLRDLEGNIMSAPYSVTVPGGVGTVSFFFCPEANTIDDGSRTFNFEITSNTRGFSNGITEYSKEAKTIAVTVNDVHPLDDILLGRTYTETEDEFTTELYGDATDRYKVYFTDLVGVNALGGVDWAEHVYGYVDDLDNPTTITVPTGQFLFSANFGDGATDVYLYDYRDVTISQMVFTLTDDCKYIETDFWPMAWIEMYDDYYIAFGGMEFIGADIVEDDPDW